jgi:hypothetical protein
MNLRRCLGWQMHRGDGSVFNMFGVQDQQVCAQALIQMPGHSQNETFSL